MSYYSITFIKTLTTGEEKANTWDTWHMIPLSIPQIAIPSVNTKYVDVPGGGSLDLTESLTGYPTFAMREGSMEFAILNTNMNTSAGDSLGYNPATPGQRDSYIRRIVDFIHGNQLRMELESEKNADGTGGNFYTGRFAIDSVDPGDTYTKITIKYKLDPFAESIDTSYSPWLWNSLQFKGGTDGDKGTEIVSYKEKAFTTTWTDNIGPMLYKTSISIKVTSDGGGTSTIVVKDNESGESTTHENIASGVSVDQEILPGMTTITATITGSGKISINFNTRTI